MTPETLTVRPATPQDLPAVDALLARSYPRLLKRDYPPSVMITAVPLLSRANPALLASGTYFVAEIDSALVGAGGWTFGAPPGGRARRSTAHVRHVATDPSHLRSGVGRAIVGRILVTARAAGALRLECMSTLTAAPFYAACGFRRLGPVEIFLRPGIKFPAVRMAKRL